MSEKYKRRKLLIDPSFQLSFILKFCMIVIVSSFVIGLSVMLFFQGSTTVAIENARVAVKSTSDFFFPQLAVTVTILAFFSAAAVLVVALLASHRISGPIFRIMREVNLIKDGDLLANFNIRERDQLRPLANSLEEMSASLKKKHVVLNGRYQALKQCLEGKDYNISEDDKEEIKSLLNDIEKSLKQFKI